MLLRADGWAVSGSSTRTGGGSKRTELIESCISGRGRREVIPAHVSWWERWMRVSMVVIVKGVAGARWDSRLSSRVDGEASFAGELVDLFLIVSHVPLAVFLGR